MSETTSPVSAGENLTFSQLSKSRGPAKYSIDDILGQRVNGQQPSSTSASASEPRPSNNGQYSQIILLIRSPLSKIDSDVKVFHLQTLFTQCLTFKFSRKAV